MTFFLIVSSRILAPKWVWWLAWVRVGFRGLGSALRAGLQCQGLIEVISHWSELNRCKSIAFKLISSFFFLNFFVVRGGGEPPLRFYFSRCREDEWNIDDVFHWPLTSSSRAAVIGVLPARDVMRTDFWLLNPWVEIEPVYWVRQPWTRDIEVAKRCFKVAEPLRGAAPSGKIVDWVLQPSSVEIVLGIAEKEVRWGCRTLL